MSLFTTMAWNICHMAMIVRRTLLKPCMQRRIPIRNNKKFANFVKVPYFLAFYPFAYPFYTEVLYRNFGDLCLIWGFVLYASIKKVILHERCQFCNKVVIVTACSNLAVLVKYEPNTHSNSSFLSLLM